jgi:hypothetical protein
MPDLFAASVVAMEICPVAPGNAQKYVDQITGYVLWGVGVLFLVAVMVSIGAIVAGRLFSMPHASKVGVISIVVVFFCAIAYMVLPGLVDSLMGSGCIGGGGSQPSAKATKK